MKLGGGSFLGGGCRLGGDDAPGRILYRNLRGIAPPGYWPEDDDALRNVLLEAYARILEHGQIAADRLLRDIFPHLAGETLTDWEVLLGAIPEGTRAEERDAVISKWRGASPPNLAGLRAAFAPLLRPVWAWRDRFDDAAVYALYETASPNGSIGETTTLSVTIHTGDGSWPDQASRLWWHINQIGDDVTLCARVASVNANDNLCGIAVSGRDQESDALLFGITQSSPVLRADHVAAGVLQTNVLGVLPSTPSAPFWLILEQHGARFDLYTNTDAEPLTNARVLYGSVEAPNVKVRYVGLVAYSASSSSGTIAFSGWRYKHASQAGNVTVLERTHADLAAYSGSPTSEPVVLQGCIVRWAEDEGSYDLRNAERLANVMQQAHAVLHVGETGFLLCNDSASLCNRGALGR